MLTTTTNSNIQLFIGSKTLPDIAPLPDDYDHSSEGRWSASCHYCDLPRDATDFLMSYCGACCVVGAIQNYTQILGKEATNPSACNFDRYVEPCALEFLVHYVGDVHQPLHVGYAYDIGGNAVKVSYFGQSSNLHKVWDTNMIEMWNSDYVSASSELQDFINQNQATVKQYIAVTDPIQWADESFYHVRNGVYNFTSTDGVGQIGQVYYNTNLPIVKQRLIAAGVRLGALLNRLLNGSNNINIKLPIFRKNIQPFKVVRN